MRAYHVQLGRASDVLKKKGHDHPAHHQLKQGKRKRQLQQIGTICVRMTHARDHIIDWLQFSQRITITTTKSATMTMNIEQRQSNNVLAKHL